MSDERALLAAIRDNPDEDTPRLVYADWLDEYATSEAGRARAELIRVQIESAGLYYQRDQFAERFRYLEARAAELQSRHAAAWLAEFDGAEIAEDGFIGGFLARLEFNADRCVATSRPPWHREPIAEVVLGGTAQAVRRLCDGWLEGVQNLDLRPDAEADADPAVEAVAGSACARALTRLSLWHDGYTDRALRAVANGPFAKLTELSGYGQYTSGGWEVVLNSASAAGLTSLTVGHRAPWPFWETNRPGPSLAPVLVNAPVHSRLRFLWIGAAGLGDSGFAALVSRGRFSQLERLHVDNDQFGAAAMRELGAATFPGLKQVRFSQAAIDDEALTELARSPLMAELERIDLSTNSLTAAGVEALAGSPRAGKIKSLNFSFNHLGDAGALALARSPHLGQFEELYLSGAHLTDVGADAIRNAPWAERLKTLFLSYNAISKPKAEELTRHFGSRLWVKGNED